MQGLVVNKIIVKLPMDMQLQSLKMIVELFCYSMFLQEVELFSQKLWHNPKVAVLQLPPIKEEVMKFRRLTGRKMDI